MRRVAILLDGLLAQGVRNAVVRAETSDGAVLFEAACGQAREDAQRPLHVGDRFHIASVTKTMTAARVLQLAEAGAFGAAGVDTLLGALDVFEPAVIDRLARKDGASFGAQITLRHLLTHTAGLRDVFDDHAEILGGPAPRSLGAHLLSGVDKGKFWPSWTPARPDDEYAGVLNFYLARGCGDAALSSPGSRFHYADTGYVILGLVIERVGREPLHHALQRHIFSPCQMTESYLAYRGDPPDLGAMRAPESDPWAGDVAVLSRGYSLSPDCGGGGVVSTTQDLSRFLRALLAGALFAQRETLGAMTRWIAPPGLEAPRVGMGLGIQHFAQGGLDAWGHTGSWGARMLWAPASGVVLTGTINQAAGPRDWHWPFLRLAQEMSA